MSKPPTRKATRAKAREFKKKIAAIRKEAEAFADDLNERLTGENIDSLTDTQIDWMDETNNKYGDALEGLDDAIEALMDIIEYEPEKDEPVPPSPPPDPEKEAWKMVAGRMNEFCHNYRYPEQYDAHVRHARGYAPPQLLIEDTMAREIIGQLKLNAHFVKQPFMFGQASRQ